MRKSWLPINSRFTRKKRRRRNLQFTRDTEQSKQSDDCNHSVIGKIARLGLARSKLGQWNFFRSIESRLHLSSFFLVFGKIGNRKSIRRKTV